MKAYSVISGEVITEALDTEYKAAHEIGVIRLGDVHLFFKKGLKHYAIAYAEMTRAFRRVELVPARMCCGKGDLAIENLVVCTEAGEAAVIQLPGTKAAKALMEELKEKAPGLSFTKD